MLMTPSQLTMTLKTILTEGALLETQTFKVSKRLELIK